MADHTALGERPEPYKGRMGLSVDNYCALASIRITNHKGLWQEYNLTPEQVVDFIGALAAVTLEIEQTPRGAQFMIAIDAAIKEYEASIFKGVLPLLEGMWAPREEENGE